MQSRGAWIALSVITGVLTIVLGVLFLARPGLSLASVLWLFGLFVIAYGIAQVVAGIIGRVESRVWAIVGGLLAVVVGIMALAWPGATALTLLYIIAAWIIISGITDLAAAFSGGLSGGQRAWLLILGALSVVVGIAFFVHPAGGALALLWAVGLYLMVLGVLRILDGFTRPPQASTA
jgi:uncharacterized membrane protein HdeD (DUF308 family)